MIEFSALPNIIQSIAILIVVVFVKLIIGRFSTNISTGNDMQYFRFYCQQLSDKVNKTSNSNDQQKVAGFIALLITLAPLVIILWLFEEFIAIEWLWQMLLLYLAFGSFNLSAISKQISQALLKNEKQIAKNILSDNSLRDSGQLSVMGLSKATIEMQLIKHLQLHIVVGFCFLLIGPIMALAYRLMLEMHYSWNIKLTKFHHFGQSSHLLLQLVLWLPTRIYYFIYLVTTIGDNFFLFWQLTRPYFFQLNSNILIELHALNLKVQLGGVAMYNQQKLRRVCFNKKGEQPEISDINASRKHLLLIDTIIVILLGIIAAISYSSMLLIG